MKKFVAMARILYRQGQQAQKFYRCSTIMQDLFLVMMLCVAVVNCFYKKLINKLTIRDIIFILHQIYF